MVRHTQPFTYTISTALEENDSKYNDFVVRSYNLEKLPNDVRFFSLIFKLKKGEELVQITLQSYIDQSKKVASNPQTVVQRLVTNKALSKISRHFNPVLKAIANLTREVVVSQNSSLTNPSFLEDHWEIFLHLI